MHISSRKEDFVNLLVRKIIYNYMYPVDLENNERSCAYSTIVVPTSKDYCDTTSQILILFTKHPRPARINKIYHPSGYLSINLKKMHLNLVYFVVWLSYKRRGRVLYKRETKRILFPLSDGRYLDKIQLCNVNALKLALC